MDHPVLTVAIPVYNDADALREAVPASIEILEGLGLSFEMILCEDASTDGSRDVAETFATADSRIKLNHSDVRRGKGGALSDALAQHTLIEKIQAGADIAVGSRFLEESTVLRSGDREMTSVGFNTMVHLLLGSNIRDHQCGFKAFRRDRLAKLIPYVLARGWTWDTEVLAIGQRCGYTIEEIPITWTEGEKTNIRTRDIFSMGWAVLGLAWRIRITGKYPKDV